MRAFIKLFALAVLATSTLTGFKQGDDPRIAMTIVDPRVERVSMHWKDSSGRVIGNIGRLKKCWTLTNRNFDLP